MTTEEISSELAKLDSANINAERYYSFRSVCDFTESIAVSVSESKDKEIRNLEYVIKAYIQSRADDSKTISDLQSLSINEVSKEQVSIKSKLDLDKMQRQLDEILHSIFLSEQK